MDDYISRQAAIDAIHKITLDVGDMSLLFKNEIAVDRLANLPSADVVSRSQLIDTIQHYAQYPDGIHKLLAVYAERRTDDL